MEKGFLNNLEKLFVNKSWLLYGKGEPFSNREIKDHRVFDLVKLTLSLHLPDGEENKTLIQMKELAADIQNHDLPY